MDKKCGAFIQWSITQPFKKIMKFAGNCMELENIIPSEVTQTQKDKCVHVFTYMCLLAVKSVTAKLQSVEPQGLGIE